MTEREYQEEFRHEILVYKITMDTFMGPILFGEYIIFPEFRGFITDLVLQDMPFIYTILCRLTKKNCRNILSTVKLRSRI